MTDLRPTGERGRGRGGRGRDYDRDGGNRGNRGGRGRGTRGRGGDDRYRDEQTDYMGRDGNKNRDRESDRQTRQPRVRMVDNQDDFPEIS